jgi:hypothetical protein
VPDAQREGRTILENLGWREERTVGRMVRGPAVAWSPTSIWGQFNFAIG